MDSSTLLSPPNRPGRRTGLLGDAEVHRRKAAVLEILSRGLPPMSGRLLRLHALLSTVPVDLHAVAAIIRTDPPLTAHLLRLCNSALFGLRRRIVRVEEAAILMGTVRLRSLVFACYLAQVTGDRLPAAEAQQFCRHSLLVAMLAEVAARWLGSQETDRAYLGGLLHDVGKLPLLMVALREDPSSRHWLRDSAEMLGLEREHFGLDHSEVGRWLALAWNLDPALVEILETHHQPELAHCDPELVGMVALADHLCERLDEEAQPAPEKLIADSFFYRCLPHINPASLRTLLAVLHQQFPRLVSVLEQTGSESEPAPELGIA